MDNTNQREFSGQAAAEPFTPGRSVRASFFSVLAVLFAAFLFSAGLAPRAALAHPADDCIHDEAEDHDEVCEVQEEESEASAETSFFMAGDPVGPAVSTFTWTPNMTPLGFSSRPVPPSGVGMGRFNSDLAFWGNYAYQGHYDGFRILDISDPANPTQVINYTQCVGSQGDVAVWGNLLIRSWDAPASATASCGGLLVGSGFEGLNIFDISNPAAPVHLRNFRMAANSTPTTGCGSHTLTLVPDVARGNLYVYNSASSTACQGIEIVRVPLADPANPVFLRREPTGRPCHDTGVILGDVNLVACAGGNGLTVLSFDPSLTPGAVGSIEDPIQLFSRSITGVTIGHSAAFSFDGEIVIFGHEPGGGGQAQCQATSSTVNRSLYFFDARTGTQLGTFVHPRPQTNTENCTWHNYNVVPTNRAHILVSGNYQSGVSVLDFTNPAAVQEIAYADPAPLSANLPIILGGDWSTYWYNGVIYESDITRGLITWKLDDRRTDGAMTLPYLNPQTQEFSFGLDKTPPVTVVTGVSDGAVYTLGAVPAAGCATTDNASGVYKEASLTVTGGTANGVGAFTATCSGAEDGAGNKAADAVATYQVNFGGMTGFLPPIKNDNTSVFNRGQAVPGKFQLGGDEGGPFVMSGWTMQKVSVNCTTFAQGAVSAAANLNTWRYDASTDQYVFNADFRQDAPGSCWRLRVTLDSGQVFDSAAFKISR